MKHQILDNKYGLLVLMVGCFLKNLDKIENGEESKKGEFHEKGNLDLNSVTDLVCIAGGCRAQNRNFLIWQVEDDGNLGKEVEDGNRGKVVEEDNRGKVEEDDNRGKVEEDGNPGKVEDGGNPGKVVDDDNPGKMEKDGSLGKDKLQVYKIEYH